MKYKSTIMNTYSIADLVQMSNIPRWKKWLLSQLMPPELYEAPPQELMRLQTGAVIGNITIDVLETGDCAIDLVN